MPILFSSEFENVCTKDIPCQILNSNSNGKWFAVITHLKLIRKPLGKLGRVSGDVIHSTTSWMQWKEASANRDVAVVWWQKSHKRSFYPHVIELLAFDLRWSWSYTHWRRSLVVLLGHSDIPVQYFGLSPLLLLNIAETTTLIYNNNCELLLAVVF